MISEARAAANAANAQLSTGPRTEEGKQQSSRNSWKHGIFSRTIVMEGESQEEFDALVKAFNSEYNPRHASELGMVRILAETDWRMRRLRRWEGVAMGWAVESKDLECKFLLTYSLYEQRLTRTFQSTLKVLQQLQASRGNEQSQSLDDAATLRHYTLVNNIPWNPADDGFVFSTADLDRQITRNRILNLARAGLQKAA